LHRFGAESASATEDSGGGMPIEDDTALAECERAGGADPNLIRIFGLMWGAIRTIDPLVESHSLELSRAAPS
jgi:hypothetical protein